MTFSIDRSDVLLIHEKDHTTARPRQCRPTARMYCLNQRRGIATNFVGRNDLLRAENRTNLCIHGIKERWRKPLCLSRIWYLSRRIFLGFHQYEDREMLRMPL